MSASEKPSYKIHRVEQKSPEWFKLRELRMTASHANAIANGRVVDKNGVEKIGKGLETYIYDMMASYYSSAESVPYTNHDLDRGNDRESDARAIYELITGNQVEEVGFIEAGEHVGCSPDGFVGDDGLVEIKSHSEPVQLRLFITGKISNAYLDQMQMQMMLTGRKWCDYVGYCPELKQSMVIIRVEADPKKHEKLRAGIEKGEKLIKKIKEQYEHPG